MSKKSHSKSYYQKKEALKNAEDELREELEQTSEEAQQALISFLKVTGIVAVVLIAGYTSFKLLSPKREADTDEKDTKPEATVAPSNKSIDPITGKIITSVATTLITAMLGAASSYLKRGK